MRCTESGLTEGSHCSVCDEVLVAQEEVPALGHSYGEWTQTIAPGKETKGEERRDCANCGHFETRKIAALGYLSDFVSAVSGLSEGLSAEETYAQLYNTPLTTSGFGTPRPSHSHPTHCKWDKRSTHTSSSTKSMATSPSTPRCPLS